VHHDYCELQLNIRKKFVLSLMAFGLLAALSWLTLSNDPMAVYDPALGFDIEVKFRTAVLAVLGALAVFTTLSFWRTTREDRHSAASQQD
jgi:hypothetical protein